MMKCPRCGTENRDGAIYCDSCGVTLGVDGIWDRDAAAPEEQQSWSKSLDMGGLYKSTVSNGPEGAQIKTDFSFMGFRETSTYPRWMITSMAFFFVALLLFLGFVVVSAALDAGRLDYVALGVAILGLALLVGYVFYRVYYTPPRRHMDEESEI